MLKAGLLNPLVGIPTKGPSGDRTRFIGRSPTVTWRPSGAMRQPLGRRVIPSPRCPGHTGAVGPRCASGESAAAPTTIPKTTSAPALRIRSSCLGSARCFTRCGVISENEVVEALDVALDEVRAFVEVRVVEPVANAFHDERRLLDIDLPVGIHRAARASRHDRIQRRRIAAATVSFLLRADLLQPFRERAHQDRGAAAGMLLVVTEREIQFHLTLLLAGA